MRGVGLEDTTPLLGMDSGSGQLSLIPDTFSCSSEMSYAIAWPRWALPALFSE